MDLFINPSNRGPSEVPAAGKVRQEDSSSPSQKTAEKVEAVVSLPVLKSSRQVQILNSASALAKKIQSSWDFLDPSALAEKIVDLERRVSLLEGDSSEIEKIRSVAERLHFQFVFPLALELSGKADGGPYSFAKTINKMANAIFKTQDLSLAKELNSTQFAETMRYAAKGRS